VIRPRRRWIRFIGPAAYPFRHRKTRKPYFKANYRRWVPQKLAAIMPQPFTPLFRKKKSWALRRRSRWKPIPRPAYPNNPGSECPFLSVLEALQAKLLTEECLSASGLAQEHQSATALLFESGRASARTEESLAALTKIVPCQDD
jgi:hypothetical protein